jgi:hypothetical protein
MTWSTRDDSDDLRLVRIDRETVVAAVAGRSLDNLGVLAPGVLPPAVHFHRGTGEPIAARFVDDRPHIEVVERGRAGLRYGTRGRGVAGIR